MSKPEVIVYSTISVDGGLDYIDKKIVLSSSRDFTRLHYFRSIVDAIMIGSNTVIKDNPLLTIRLPAYAGRQPYRVVVDGDLKLKPDYRVFDTTIAPSILITSIDNCYSEKTDLFRKKNIGVICTNRLTDKELDLNKALIDLNKLFNINKILVEGGGYLIGTLIKQKLVDKIVVSISPTILGLNKVDLIRVVLDKPLKLNIMNIYYDDLTNEVIISYKPDYSSL
ncbi:MAG: RibD family protein [Desulfurococcaceae archaeon]